MTIDLLFAGALMVFGLIGYLSGFWMQLMRLVVLISAYILAGIIGKPLGPTLAEAFGIPTLMGQVVGTFMAFIVLYVILSSVGWVLLRRRRKAKDGERAARRKRWDSLAGAAFAMGKTFLILFLLLNALVLVESRLEKSLKRADVGYDESLMVGLARDHNLIGSLHLPVIGDIESLSRLSSDPAYRERVLKDPALQRALKHPKIQALLGDRSIIQASKSRDMAAILASPRLNKALDDPEVREILSGIDLSKIE